MAINQQDIDNLDAAIVSGELTVSFQGRTVTYQTTDSLIKARNYATSVMRQQQGAGAATFGGTRFSLARFSD